MNIQWYPGHVTKAKWAMREDIELIDLVIELVDTRVLPSGRNPSIDSLAVGKARMVLLNESDLADERLNAQWVAWSEAKGIHAVKIGARNKEALKQIQGVIQQACRDKIERDRKQGISNRPVRTMAVGIPNVGKSAFISSSAGKARTKTGNKPGVTEENQWVRLNKTLELLDTPGILWPRSDDQSVRLELALIGSINDQILNKDELAGQCIHILEERYPGTLLKRFDLEAEDKEPATILEDITRARSYLMKGGELDVARISVLLLNDFRAGRLERVILEQPGE